MRILLMLTCIFLIADLIADTATAETLQIPKYTATDTNETEISLPVRGSSKQEVEESFGEPISISQAVGEPPISIWHYSEFSAYFEANILLHSVKNRI